MASTLPPDRPPGPISSTGADAANTPETDNGADVQPQTSKGSPSFQSSALSERNVEQSENIHPQMKSGEELAAQSKEKLQELLNNSALSNSYRRHAESKQIDSVKDLLKDVSGAIDCYSGNAAENFRSVVSEMMARKPKLEKLSIVMNIPPQYRDVHLVPPGDDLERCEGDLEQILNIAKQMADGLGVKNQAEITDNDDKRVMEEGVQSFESILKHLDPDSRQDAFNQFRAFQNPRVEIGVNWSDLSNNSAWQPPDLSRCPPHLKPKEAEFDLTSEPDFEAPFVDERLDQLQAQLRSEALKAGGDLTETQLAATEANIAGMGKTAKELMHTEHHIPGMFMFNSAEGLQPPKLQDNGDPSSTHAPAKQRGPESSEEMARREDLSRSGKKPRAGDEEYERTLGDSGLPTDVEDEDDDVFGPNQTYTPNRRGRLSRSSGDDDTPKSPVFRGPPPPPGGRDGEYFRFPPAVEGALASAIRTRRPYGPYETSLPLDENQQTAREDLTSHDNRGFSSSSTTPRSSVSSVDEDWEALSLPRGQLHPFRLDYEKDVPGDSQKQARAILDHAKTVLDEMPQLKGVAITYSANHDQTLKIFQTYDSDQWKTGTGGSNQGSVMAEMETLLETEDYQSLQEKVRIAPISTMKQAGNVGVITDEEVDLCLNNLEALIKDGWQVFAWQNQDSIVREESPFAIGGGVGGEGFLSTSQSQRIQQTLLALSMEEQSPARVMMSPSLLTASSSSSVKSHPSITSVTMTEERKDETDEFTLSDHNREILEKRQKAFDEISETHKKVRFLQNITEGRLKASHLWQGVAIPQTCVIDALAGAGYFFDQLPDNVRRYFEEHDWAQQLSPDALIQGIAPTQYDDNFDTRNEPIKFGDIEVITRGKDGTLGVEIRGIGNASSADKQELTQWLKAGYGYEKPVLALKSQNGSGHYTVWDPESDCFITAGFDQIDKEIEQREEFDRNYQELRRSMPELTHEVLNEMKGKVSSIDNLVQPTSDYLNGINRDTEGVDKDHQPTLMLINLTRIMQPDNI